jgi:hypothetical protein
MDWRGAGLFDRRCVERLTAGWGGGPGGRYGLGCGAPPPACFPLGFLPEPPPPPPGATPPARRRRASMANIADQHAPFSAPDAAVGGGGDAGGWSGLRRSKSDEDLPAADLFPTQDGACAAAEAARRWLARPDQEPGRDPPARVAMRRVGSVP